MEEAHMPIRFLNQSAHAHVGARTVSVTGDYSSSGRCFFSQSGISSLVVESRSRMLTAPAMLAMTEITPPIQPPSAIPSLRPS